MVFVILGLKVETIGWVQKTAKFLEGLRGLVHYTSCTGMLVNLASKRFCSAFWQGVCRYSASFQIVLDLVLWGRNDYQYAWSQIPIVAILARVRYMIL